MERSAEILAVEIDAPGALEIASRSRGTPRIANRLLRRVRDYAQVRGRGRLICQRRKRRCRCSKWIVTASTKWIASCC